MYPPLRNEDVGKLVLRLTVGVLMLFHGVSKMMHTSAVNWIGSQFTGMGLPAEFAYAVYLGEVVAPLMIILGLLCRWGAALVVTNMIFAIALAHSAELFEITERGAWALELQGFYLFSAFALVFLGSGGYALRQD